MEDFICPQIIRHSRQHLQYDLLPNCQKINLNTSKSIVIFVTSILVELLDISNIWVSFASPEISRELQRIYGNSRIPEMNIFVPESSNLLSVKNCAFFPDILLRFGEKNVYNFYDIYGRVKASTWWITSCHHLVLKSCKRWRKWDEQCGCVMTSVFQAVLFFTILFLSALFWSRMIFS